VQTVQNVRAVWNGDKWELHFVCKEEVDVTDSAGDGVAGVDPGIKNVAAVAFPDEYVLYPGNTVKQDKQYFTESSTTLKLRTVHQQKLSGHEEKVRGVRRISSTFSLTPSLTSVLPVMLGRWR
jgi:transposase